MKLKKFIALFSAVAVAASMTITSFAADAMGIAKNGTTIALDQLDGGSATDTTADLTVSWEDGKIIFKFAVQDSELDSTHANVWEQDSIELRVDSKTELRVQAETGTISATGGDMYDVDWNLTDGGYEITATYNNADVKAGYSFTFAAQVNCATAGTRECTLHFDAAHGNAWSSDAVRTPAALIENADDEVVFTGEEAAPVVAALPDSSGDIVFFEGESSCASWGQAVELPTLNNDGNFDYAIIQPGCIAIVTYSGSEPEVVLQSWSGGEGWAKVAASSADGSVATFTYDDMAAAYGTDFSTLDKFIVGATDDDITVTKVVLNTGKTAAPVATVTSIEEDADEDAPIEDENNDDVSYEEPATDTIAEINAVSETVATSETTVAAAGNTTTAATSSKGSANTGIEGVAVIAGLAVIGAGAVIISKKRK